MSSKPMAASSIRMRSKLESRTDVTSDSGLFSRSDCPGDPYIAAVHLVCNQFPHGSTVEIALRPERLGGFHEPLSRLAPIPGATGLRIDLDSIVEVDMHDASRPTT